MGQESLSSTWVSEKRVWLDILLHPAILTLSSTQQHGSFSSQQDGGNRYRNASNTPALQLMTLHR